MENAHLRFGLLEYMRITERASTRIRLRVDRYIGEDRQAHLLSVFGNDSDVGAITAPTASSPSSEEKPRVTCALGKVATSGASKNATAPTKTALARIGRAVEEKNGAKATIPLTRTRTSVMEQRKLPHSISFPCGIVFFSLAVLTGTPPSPRRCFCG